MFASKCHRFTSGIRGLRVCKSVPSMKTIKVQYLREWEYIYIHGDGVTRPGTESYCTLLYGNSLIKAGSHTVELFSDFARNLCTAHQTLCVSPSDCCGCLQTSRRNHARSSHANHQKPITRAILRTTTHLCHSWSTDVTPTIQTHLLTHFRTNISY